MNREYEQTIRNQFPNLVYSEFRLIDNRSERLGIDDLSFTMPDKQALIQELVELFVLSCKGFTYFYSAQELSIGLNNKLDDVLEKLDPERTVLVFPGKGAQAVKQLVRPEVFKFFASLDISVKRLLAQDMSVSRVNVLTGRNDIKPFLPKKLVSCVIIDDVLLSGATAQTVRSNLDQRKNFDWYAAAWMALSPLQAKARKAPDCNQSSLPGFRKVVTKILYQGENGIPANNSLSSFAEFDEKSGIVIEGYKRKYVEDAQTFDQAIGALRRIKNE